MKITDIAKAVSPNAKQKIIVLDQEKLHEQMIEVEDSFARLNMKIFL